MQISYWIRNIHYVFTFTMLCVIISSAEVIIMNSRFYILNLRIQGIKNIEKPIEISFYKKTINNDFNPDEYKIKGIYGENGSGKTAIILAVNIMRNIMIDKSYLSDSMNQKLLVESVNKKTMSGFIECEYYVTNDTERHIYKYYISFEIRDDDRFYLINEKLECKNGNYSKNQYITLYETKNGVLTSLNNPELLSEYKEKTQNLLTQRAFTTWVFENDFVSQNYNDSLIKGMVNVLLLCLSLVVSLDDADNHIMYFLNKRIGELDDDSLSEIKMDIINEIKNRIESVRNDEIMIPKSALDYYKSYINNLYRFVQIFKPELRAIDIDTKDHGEYYKGRIIMYYDDYSLDKEFESRGIKKLIHLYDYLNNACNGYIVFIDELDSNINDVYLDKIIEHFAYYGKGQLCFTAHNLSPMSILKEYKNSISFISSINTVHTWTRNGNQSPENAYKNGFIEDSPFNVDASDFLGIIGGEYA